MNKTELVDAMAKASGLSKKDAEKALNAFTETVGAELKKKEIDFSDIPEMTESEALELYPRNWKPVKQAISVRIDSDTLEWLKQPREAGYQKRLNAALRWARIHGCPIQNF